MVLIDTIKAAVSIIQKTDNLELYKLVLDIQKLALDQQDAIQKLKEENQALKKQLSKKKKIIRHKEAVITIKDEQQVYCATCYGKDEKLIQMIFHGDCYFCPNCQTTVHIPLD